MNRERTRYHGPVTVANLEFAGRRVTLVHPADPDRMLDDPTVQAWNHRDDYMPYWAYLWPGALLLAEVVARETWPIPGPDGEPLRALEIGCGMGLAGLVALGRGLTVCFSDYDPAPLEFVARNAERNGFDRSRYETRLLDWRDLPEEPYPVILGSDVLYESKLVPLVARLLGKLLARGGLGLIACPGRASAEGFGEAVAAVGLSVAVGPASARSESGGVLEGLIYRVSRTESAHQASGRSSQA
jgi:predicted nicotinamide N-methyase